MKPGEEYYTNKLKEISNNKDIEERHAQADTILCLLLLELKYDDLVAEYNKIEKWYA